MAFRMRELSRADLAEINRWRNEPDAVDRLGSPFRYVDSEVDSGWFNDYLSSRGSNVRLAVCDGESKALLGLVYLLNIDACSRYGELSIWIPDARHRGRGIGSFAMQGMLRHAFDDMNLHRVWLRALASNETAIALYRKFGFREEGVLREAVFKDGRYQDMLQMSILAPEYRAREANQPGLEQSHVI